MKPDKTQVLRKDEENYQYKASTDGCLYDFKKHILYSQLMTLLRFPFLDM